MNRKFCEGNMVIIRAKKSLYKGRHARVVGYCKGKCEDILNVEFVDGKIVKFREDSLDPVCYRNDKGMAYANEPAIYWWAWLQRSDWLKECEAKLAEIDPENDPEKMAGFYRYCIVEAKMQLTQMYKKMLKMPEYGKGILEKPDWMDLDDPETDENNV